MRGALALVMAGALAGCGQADEPHRLRPGQSPTIVSLNPCTDAVLAEVTAPGQLLSISHYSHDPASSSLNQAVARRFPANGGTAEEVIALDPDIVVAGSFLAPATRGALEDMGLRVVTFGIATDVAGSMAQVRELAALAGKPQAGERLVARIEAALEVARPGAGEPEIEAALWQPGGIVPGEASLIGDLLRRTGFESYSARRGMAQADYLPLERIAADPPELLLVAGREAGQRHAVLDRLPGMRRADFDPSLLYCGGPTIVRAAERLAHLRKGGA